MKVVDFCCMKRQKRGDEHGAFFEFPDFIRAFKVSVQLNQTCRSCRKSATKMLMKQTKAGSRSSPSICANHLATLFRKPLSRSWHNPHRAKTTSPIGSIVSRWEATRPTRLSTQGSVKLRASIAVNFLSTPARGKLHKCRTSHRPTVGSMLA